MTTKFPSIESFVQRVIQTDPGKLDEMEGLASEFRRSYGLHGTIEPEKLVELLEGLGFTIHWNAEPPSDLDGCRHRSGDGGWEIYIAKPGPSGRACFILLHETLEIIREVASDLVGKPIPPVWPSRKLEFLANDFAGAVTVPLGSLTTWFPCFNYDPMPCAQHYKQGHRVIIRRAKKASPPMAPIGFFVCRPMAEDIPLLREYPAEEGRGYLEVVDRQLPSHFRPRDYTPGFWDWPRWFEIRAASPVMDEARVRARPVLVRKVSVPDLFGTDQFSYGAYIVPRGRQRYGKELLISVFEPGALPHFEIRAEADGAAIIESSTRLFGQQRFTKSVFDFHLALLDHAGPAEQPDLVEPETESASEDIVTKAPKRRSDRNQRFHPFLPGMEMSARKRPGRNPRGIAKSVITQAEIDEISQMSPDEAWELMTAMTLDPLDV